MLTVFKFFLGWITSGPLDRALTTVDKYVENQTDRERIRGSIIETHMTTRADWMKAGGFWTLLLFAVPTAFHYSAVVVYSTFWCANCAYPKTWTIAALPGTMGEWEGWTILACIGGLGLFTALRK
jgi:hypothetical protein